MQQIPNYGDQRQLTWCVQCGGKTGTRDHVPPKVLLDEPYPENLPVVPTCLKCNNDLSVHEEYVACLVECILRGSVEPSDMRRDKIGRILAAKPPLASRLRGARQEASGGIVFTVERERIQSVILKLARGHAAFEANEPHVEAPASVTVNPFPTMSEDEVTDFEAPPSGGGITCWPEVGSRAMQRLVEDDPGAPLWIIVQPGRYRYLVFVGVGLTVRMVLSEYLACEVHWGRGR